MGILEIKSLNKKQHNLEKEIARLLKVSFDSKKDVLQYQQQHQQHQQQTNTSDLKKEQQEMQEKKLNTKIIQLKQTLASIQQQHHNQIQSIQHEFKCLEQQQLQTHQKEMSNLQFEFESIQKNQLLIYANTEREKNEEDAKNKNNNNNQILSLKKQVQNNTARQ